MNEIRGDKGDQGKVSNAMKIPVMNEFISFDQVCQGQSDCQDLLDYQVNVKIKNPRRILNVVEIYQDCKANQDFQD